MKKLVCLLLAFSLIFSLSTVFADEEYEENTYEYEYVYEQYEIISQTVLVDGVEHEANILIQKFGDWSDVYIQIAPLARSFGYTVTYIEETDSVTFEKDGVYLELCLPDSYEVTTDSYVDVISYEDRTYVQYQYVERLIDFLIPESQEYSYVEGTSYSYYTEDALIDEYKDKFSGYEELLSVVQKGTYEETETADLSLAYNNDTFGVNIKGGMEIKANSLFDNGAFKVDIDITTEGLLNLLELITQGQNIDEGTQFNPDETISFSVISDGKDLYIKGKPVESMVSADIPYFLEEEGWEEELNYAEKAKTGWIKLDTGETVNVNEVMSAEGFVTSIIKMDMDFETKKTILDIMSYLYQYIDLASKEDADGFSYKVTIDKAFAEILAGFIDVEIPDVAEDFEIVIEEVYNNDLTGKSEVSGKLVLNNVYQNDLNIDSGSLEIKLSSCAVRNPSEEKINTPDEFVSLKELQKKFDELYDKYWEITEY